MQDSAYLICFNYKGRLTNPTSKYLNKRQLIEIVAVEGQITATQAERLVNGIVKTIYRELANGGSVNIQGFGQFMVSHRASRLGVNPRQPSQKITIPELNTPKFRAGEAFKAAVALNK